MENGERRINEDMHKNHMHNMKPYFHTDFGDTLLFKSWLISGVNELIVICILYFVSSIFYEAIKSCRIFSSHFILKEHLINKKCRVAILSKNHIIQTVFHIIQFALSFILMLGFMSCNTWICLSIVLGSGVGYFLFGWKREVSFFLEEHCG